MLQRGGEVVRRRLANVHPRTSTPRIHATIALGTCIDTEAYAIESRLEPGGDAPASVWHSRGADARDDEGDGLHEVHVTTMEGLGSLLRSWLRPHRGISQEHVPLYLGFFEFMHNVRRRGKALVGALLELLLT
jgi:transposase